MISMMMMVMDHSCMQDEVVWLSSPGGRLQLLLNHLWHLHLKALALIEDAPVLPDAEAPRYKCDRYICR